MFPAIAIVYAVTYGPIPGVSVRDRTTDLEGSRHTPVIRGAGSNTDLLEEFKEKRLKLEKEIAELEKLPGGAEDAKRMKEVKKKLDELILKFEQVAEESKDSKERRR